MFYLLNYKKTNDEKEPQIEEVSYEEVVANVEKIKNGDRTSNVTDFSYMFDNTEFEEPLDISGFDMSKADTVERMFKNCSAPEILVNGTWLEELGDDTVFEGCSANCVTIVE